MEADKRQFTQAYPGYGYGGSVDEWRHQEFARMKDVVYLDHGGATLHTSSQMRQVTQLLETELHGNPHSQGVVSRHTSDAVENVRDRVLGLFGVSRQTHDVVFTAGATGALKLVGECFPWTSASQFCYTMDNHTSVVGIRQYALREGATVSSLDHKVKRRTVHKADERKADEKRHEKAHEDKDENEAEDATSWSLFAFPAESNFSGDRYPMQEWIQQAQAGRFGTDVATSTDPTTADMSGPSGRSRWAVLLDAAKYCATHSLDLSVVPADFVCLSFYKLFGFPTGLGALLVRKPVGDCLRSCYFGGGTVGAVAADEDFHVSRTSLAGRLEDGSVSFLSILSLNAGLDMLDSLSLARISTHTQSLADWLRDTLSSMTHSNGTPVVKLYSLVDRCKDTPMGDSKDSSLSSYTHGPTVTFSVLQASGELLGHAEVDKLASSCNIQLRTGCFCNPGACQVHLELSAQDLRHNQKAGHVCWDDKDVVDGRPTGAVRVSVGYCSTFEDVHAFVSFVNEYLVSTVRDDAAAVAVHEHGHAQGQDAQQDVESKLSHVIVYPIKSCAGFSVHRWPLGPHGLRYDREWALVGDNGHSLTQQRVPALCSLRPELDLERQLLVVRAVSTDIAPLVIPLQDIPSSGSDVASFKVCGQDSCGVAHDQKTRAWFKTVLGHSCTLMRTVSITPAGNVSPSNFANRSQYVLCSENSVSSLLARHGAKALLGVDNAETSVAGGGADQLEQRRALEALLLARFRPNLVCRGLPAFAEDTAARITIGEHNFSVEEPCVRCAVINIDQLSGARASPLLAQLGTQRRRNGRVVFGVLMNREESGVEPMPEASVQVGQPVTLHCDAAAQGAEE